MPSFFEWKSRFARKCKSVVDLMFIEPLTVMLPLEIYPVKVSRVP